MMEQSRIGLSGLRITNGEKVPASVDFTPGLNVVVGASNTGKSYLFEAIDFMLGGGTPLRNIAASEGYSRAWLDLDPTVGPPVTLCRAIAGGDVELNEFASGRDQLPSLTTTVSARHSNNMQSLSYYLLTRIGLENRQIRKDANGKIVSFTFRHVAHLTLINETRIITTASPILTENDYQNHTAEKNAFGLFLTGKDDSAIVKQVSKKDRNARIRIEIELLESLVNEKRTEVEPFKVSREELLSQDAKLKDSIEALRTVELRNRKSIDLAESNREALASERIQAESRRLFFDEQRKRLLLLRDFYQTDLKRLEAVIEASIALHDLPQGICPICQHPLDSKESSPHANLELACRAEIVKLEKLLQGLISSIGDVEDELGNTKREISSKAEEIERWDKEISDYLLPRVTDANESMSELLTQRLLVGSQIAQVEEFERLNQRLEQAKASLKEALPKPVFENRVTTSTSSELCEVIEGILESWRYPAMGKVAFDTEKQDFVIGGIDRANTGKGYRAISSAAFAIGLMRYCRLKNFPHPGFVGLDTPLNPFKGAASAGDEKVAPSVQEAFFEDLLADASGDQFIIIENNVPEIDLANRCRFYEFTKNSVLDRYGFFPWQEPEPQ